jgi:hypothetical protein
MTEKFDERVWASIREMSKKCNYHPSIFIGMIQDYGAVEAVKRVINDLKITYGYEKLWECGHLELSMESIIQEDEWKDLFTDAEREKARKRLQEDGYGGKTKDKGAKNGNL